jgi:hypothetical protein
MSRSKKIYVLLGVFAIISLITVIVSRTEQKKEEIQNSDETILAIAADDVTTLSWEVDDSSYAFHKDGSWLYDEDEAFPVSESKIASLLSMFEDFGVSFIIENVEDFGQYGLDDPVGTINIATADQEITLTLGDFSTMDSERYVSIGDGNVYLVSTDPYDSFNVELSSLIDNDEIPNITAATEIVYSGAESGDVVYDENLDSDCTSDVYYLEQDSAKLPLDTDNVSSYLSKLYYMSLSDYATYNASADDLVSYGLSDPELTLVISYKDDDEVEQSVQLTLGRTDEQKSAADSESEEETEATYDTDTDTSSVGGYLRVGQSQIVYELSSTNYENLLSISYDSLRHKDVFVADFSSVEKMVITLDGGEYTILASGDADNRTYTYEGSEIDITDIKSALTALSADSFTTEAASGEEEISLTLYVTKDDDSESIITITLYREDGSECVAEVNGEPVSLVARSSAMDLVEAVYAVVLN